VRAEVLAANLPDDPAAVAAEYFPRAVRERFGRRIPRHPLVREIAATQLASNLIDRVGPGFLYRLEERTGAATPAAARAFRIVQDVFDLPWSAADGLPPSPSRPCCGRFRRSPSTQPRRCSAAARSAAPGADAGLRSGSWRRRRQSTRVRWPGVTR
jgi:hypothetical protein